MSCNEGIDSSGSPGKIVGGIWKGASDRTQEYPSTIDDHHPAIIIYQKKRNTILLLHGAAKSWLGHFEGKAHNELHERVEDNVLHVDVDKLICEEAPDFIAPAGVVDEVGADGCLACQGRF